MDDGERGLAAEKADLRTDVRRRRLQRTDAERASLAALLCDVVVQAPQMAGARTVAAYYALPGEPDTSPLRAALAAAGVQVLLPVVPPIRTEGAPPRLDWAVDDGALAPGALGVGEPTGARLGADAVAAADVVLVPALLVDTRGVRLGQGGGYYDATLSALGGTAPVVALVHDDELVDADALPVPSGSTDRRVTDVATPSRWWHVPQ